MKKVLITGLFNVLHLGHIRLLNYAKSLGDHLIVGIESDKFSKRRSTNSQSDRLETLKNISSVDEVFIMDNVEKSLLKYKPDIVVKGDEFQGKKNKEEKIIKKLNASLVYSSANSFSVDSTEINNKNNFLDKDTGYLKRNKISNKKLFKIINNFKNLNVCIIGDFILDEYISCNPIGMSQEDYTVTYRRTNHKYYLGGSAIVAAHAAKLGSKVDYYTVVGYDEKLNKKLEEYKSPNLRKFIFYDKTRPTILKQRYRTKDRNVFKLSVLDERSIDLNIQNEILNKIKSSEKNYDLVIFSDFNYGVLNKKIVSQLTAYFKNKKTFISADSQYSSQTGDMSKFKNVSLIMPTEYEVRSMLRDNDSGLIVIIDKLKKNYYVKI